MESGLRSDERVKKVIGLRLVEYNDASHPHCTGASRLPWRPIINPCIYALVAPSLHLLVFAAARLAGTGWLAGTAPYA